MHIKHTARAIAAAFTLTLTLSACSEGTNALSWADVLIPILKELFSGSQEYSQTNTYTGTAQLEAYNYNSTANTYDRDSKQTAAIPATIQIASNDTICQITADNLSIGNDKIQQLVFATYYNAKTNTISPNHDYLTGGQCTYNGKTNTPLDAACFTGHINNQELTLQTIYFTIGNRLFKGTFQGTQPTK